LCAAFDQMWIDYGGAGHYPVYNGIDYDYSNTLPILMPLTGLKWQAKGIFYPESSGET
jgi:hypothetical protein